MRKGSYRSVYVASASIALVAGGTPAWSQDANGEALAENERSAVADIIVTARKRDERAQDTPISLSVATGDMLKNRSAQNFVDLQYQTPSLHIVPSTLSATSTNVSMRGQALVDIRLNIDPTIAIYQDGVYLPRAQGSNAADLLDINRVEVMAGPQGTLYGKNSSGGAINIFTNTPTDKFEGLVQGRYGSYGERQIGAVLNTPISDSLALRFVGSLSGRSGYGNNTLTGQDLGRSHTEQFRMTALIKPTEGLSVTLRGDYTHAHVIREAAKAFSELAPLVPATAATLGGPLVVADVALQMNGLTVGSFFAQPLDVRNAQLQQAYDYLLSAFNSDEDDNSADLSSFDKVKLYGVSGQIDYRLSDNLSFRSLTAYRGFKRNGQQDLDGTPYVLLQYPYQFARDNQFSQESQISYQGIDNRLNAITGVYYSRESGVEGFDQDALLGLSGPGATLFQRARAVNKSFGVFAQASFRFAPQWSATGGVRYTKDKRFLGANNYTATLCQTYGVPLADVGGPAGCELPASVSFGKISYTASVEYKPARDVMLYVKSSRGYRSGGLQESSTATTPEAAALFFVPFRPETVTDYEVGLKSELFDRRLRANLTYYHSIQKDAIRVVSLPAGTQVGILVQNAASAKIDGIEFDLTALPTPALELSLNGAYTDARFSRYITPTGEDRSALPLLFTPEWQVGASAAYTAELEWGRWRTQIDYSYTGRQLSGESFAYSPAHALVNARSTVTLQGPDLTIAIYAKNLTNRRYLNYTNDLTNLGGILADYYNPPRTFGVEVTKRF